VNRATSVVGRMIAPAEGTLGWHAPEFNTDDG